MVYSPSGFKTSKGPLTNKISNSENQIKCPQVFKVNPYETTTHVYCAYTVFTKPQNVF